MKVTSVVLVCLTLAAASWAGATEPAEVSSPLPEAGTVTLDLKDAPLQSVIDTLFKGSGSSYIIDSGVEKNKLVHSMSLKGVTLEQAVKTLTKAAGVSYYRNGGIYHFAPRAALHVPLPPQREPEPQKTDEHVTRRVEKIYLSFIDAQDVAAMFGAAGFKSRGSVLVTGGAGTQRGGWTGGGAAVPNTQMPVARGQFQTPYNHQATYYNQPTVGFPPAEL